MSETPQNDQGQLFEAASKAEIIDISQAAQHISKNARPFEYEDRTSDAARDQGHGPQAVVGIEEVSGTDQERQAARRRGTHPSARAVELPGQSRGRSNTPGIATPSEAQRGLTDQEIVEQDEINKRGVKAARKALKDALRSEDA